MMAIIVSGGIYHHHTSLVHEVPKGDLVVTDLPTSCSLYPHHQLVNVVQFVSGVIESACLVT